MCVAAGGSQWFEIAVATICTLVFFGIGIFLEDELMQRLDIQHAPSRARGRVRGGLGMRRLGSGGIDEQGGLSRR